MAQKAIREYSAKKIIQKNWQTYFPNLELIQKSFLYSEENSKLPEWSKNTALVVKPDMCFGKRSKNNLVFFKDKKAGDVTYKKAQKWLKQKIAKNTTIHSKFDKLNNPLDPGKSGVLTHFLVEPFTPHSQEQEFYLSIQTDSEADILNFSKSGGVDIEENWNSEVTTMKIPLENPIQYLQSKFSSYDNHLQEFIIGTYKLFKELHFSYLELNPFLIVQNQIVLLDTVAKLDDTAQLIMKDKWGNEIDFPTPFGLPDKDSQVLAIEDLDSKTGASLKLTILNPKGQIWTLLAGGGASIVAIDAITEITQNPDLIANYGEYSGNPSQEQTFQYADHYLQLLTKYPEIKNKKLIISGAIANFTDIAKTFDGIIQAIKLHSNEIKKQEVEIFVRRGGPNYKKGLENIELACQKLGIPIQCYGPEIGIVDICKKALINISND